MIPRTSLPVEDLLPQDAYVPAVLGEFAQYMEVHPARRKRAAPVAVDPVVQPQGEVARRDDSRDGFGSFCAASAAGPAGSTIGEEKRSNPALTLEEDGYVTALVEGQDAYPAY